MRKVLQHDYTKKRTNYLEIDKAYIAAHGKTKKRKKIILTEQERSERNAYFKEVSMPIGLGKRR